ncbi:ABC transporter permease DevC [Moorena bouillonii]|uniref:ABC transporter n=1 Tax=Moorena bouillonii PNG TaxID=568701 RepID=A0A1U7MW60_9CYAN|nr:ABC transporter permease DevC [Moorena bouillonii]NEO49647.1 FtsX-like permease family protein [Moorena sp. SIO4A3]OLT57933.1 ABC transporter [Moorena bouillonii PNG]
MKIPLAWLQLTHEKMRLLVALAGIAFADILMFMQMGFRDALFESNVTLHNSLQGDIFLISPQSQATIAMKSFPSRRLYQSIAFDGVKSIRGIYMDYALWKNPQTSESRNVLVIGFNPTDNVFNLSGVTSNLDTIKMPDVVLFDDSSRPEYGPIAEEFNQGKEITTEVKQRRIRVGGLFTLGASFAADGNVITSDLNFFRLFPDRHRGLIDIGLIELEPGLDLEIVVEKMRRELSKDVLVLSKEEFVNWEKAYWQSSTAIGFIFTLGSAMGFIVGTVIVYQILYTDVADHLPEYATLKAMGYKTSYLLIVVFQEAIILAILGYFPGYGLALGLYSLTKNATSLPIAMSLARAVTVLILTIIMCCISGAIAIGKLQAADPADIF